jgi:hypothetical protein
MGNMDTAYAIYLMGFLILVVSSLVARKLPIGSMLKMGFIWVCIFSGLFMAFLLAQSLGVDFSKFG